MSTPAPPPDRPLRRDAERNRQRILDAARIVFAERGLRGSHDDIAREAGVGVGTVYRRFPDKQELIDALFAERMAEIAALAQAGLELDDPWEGLVHFLVQGMEMQSADLGLKELTMGTEEGAARVARARDAIAPLVEQLLVRAQAAGVVREDVTLTDLPMLQMAVGAVVDATRDVAPETWRRAMAVLLDGLRPPGATPLGPRPLTMDEFTVAMHTGHGAR